MPMFKIKLGHIALKTPCYEKTLAFYSLFGGVVEQEDTLSKNGQTINLALVRIGDLVIEVIETPGLDIEADGANERFAHLCFDIQGLDGFVEELKTKGVDTFKTQTVQEMGLFGGLRNINLYGPNGELLELYEKKTMKGLMP